VVATRVLIASPWLLIFGALLATPFHPLPVKAVIAALALLAWRRPDDALLILAAIGPIAVHITQYFGVRGAPTYLLVAPVLAVRLLDAGARFDRFVRLRAALVAVVLASAAVEWRVEAASQLDWPLAVTDWLRGGFLEPTPASLIFDTPLLWLTSIALFGVVGAAAARRPAIRDRLIVALCVGGAAAAVFPWLRVAESSLRTADPWQHALNVLTLARVDETFRDVNAAGSYFVFVTVLAAALWRGGLGARAGAILTSALCLAAAVLARSKAALLALVLAVAAGAIAALFRGRSRATRIAGGLVLIGVAAGAIAVVSVASNRLRESAAEAVEFRQGFSHASAAMIRHAPVFGVGLGRYYGEFPRFAPDWLLAAYPHENAHNYFLQIAAELGVVTLGLWLFLVFRSIWFPGSSAPGPLRLAIVVFLITCLTGHPLLIPSIAVVWWMAVGLAAGWTDGRERATSLMHPRWLAVLILLLAISVPFRMAARIDELDLTHVAAGVSRWSPASDPPRVRTIGRRARFYVPGDVDVVTFDLRKSTGVPGPVSIDMMFDGRLANRIVLDDDAWHEVQLPLPAVSRRFFPIELRVDGPPSGGDETIDAGVNMTWIRTGGRRGPPGSSRLQSGR
jgi:hypothetical protein